jgi:two-component system NtrC family response regulator
MTPHILLVDDDEKICRLITKLFQREGYDVSYVLNVHDALNCATTLQIDLILSLIDI